MTTTQPSTDFKAIADDAYQATVRDLSTIDDPAEQMKAAALLADETTPDLEAARARRDVLMLSLNIYDRYRGLTALAGVAPSNLHTKRRQALGTIPKRKDNPMVRNREAMVRKAKSRGIAHIPKDAAIEELPEVAATVARLDGTVRGALEVRDRNIAVLVARGMGRSDVAALIGRDRSLVTHQLSRKAAGE